MKAPPTPCSARAAMKNHAAVEKPHSAELSVNSAIAAGEHGARAETLDRPGARQNEDRQRQRVDRHADAEIDRRDVAGSRAIFGSAVVRIVASRNSMKKVAATSSASRVIVARFQTRNGNIAAGRGVFM